jgi:hypothetical protein
VVKPASFRREPRELVFFLDEDVKALKSLFPKKRVKTLADLRLKLDTDDAEIVEIARNRGFTIVTANANDFKKAIVDFQRKGAQGNCSCLYGLIILPTGHEVQRRLMSDRKAVEQRLRFGDEAITWKDVRKRNYEVRLLRVGAPRVVELPPPCKLPGGHWS